MDINNVKLIQSLYPGNPTQAISQIDDKALITSDMENKVSFSDIIKNSINNLDNKQLESNHAIQGLVSGEADDLHNVMIKTTEAQISLELAVQLRNRSLEAMNEIKNMQF